MTIDIFVLHLNLLVLNMGRGHVVQNALGASATTHSPAIHSRIRNPISTQDHCCGSEEALVPVHGNRHCLRPGPRVARTVFVRTLICQRQETYDRDIHVRHSATRTSWESLA